MDPPLPRSVLNQLYTDDSWYVSKIPSLDQVLEPRIVLSVIGYTLAFQFLAFLTRIFLWNNATGFRQYRLRNITICLVHSTFCGAFVLYFSATRFHYMINNPIFYNEEWMGEVLLVSIGYFIHDCIDMSKYELSRWSIELFAHHILTATVLMVAVLSNCFVPYAYWSLLMECNSVFLHIRTLFHLSGANKTKPLCLRIIKHINILTFVIFRFISPAMQIKFVLNHTHNFRPFYFLASFGSGVVFYIINIFLFIRVLASDGYLGEYGRKHTAIGRDQDAMTEDKRSN